MKNTIGLERMDQTDLNILCAVRQNARETLTTISRNSGMPISSAFDRLRSLEAQGVIARYTALLDWKKIGFNERVILLLRVDKSRKEKIETWLMKNAKVNGMTRISGDWDLVLDLLFQNIAEIESFIDALKKSCEGIEIQILHVLDEIRQEAFLSDSFQYG